MIANKTLKVSLESCYSVGLYFTEECSLRKMQFYIKISLPRTAKLDHVGFHNPNKYPAWEEKILSLSFRKWLGAGSENNKHTPAPSHIKIFSVLHSENFRFGPYAEHFPSHSGYLLGLWDSSRFSFVVGVMTLQWYPSRWLSLVAQSMLALFSFQLWESLLVSFTSQ